MTTAFKAYEVETDRYEIRDRDGDVAFTMAREQGLTDNGNPLNGRWVLRDAGGGWVDFDTYRNDLMERHAIDAVPSVINAEVASMPRRKAAPTTIAVPEGEPEASGPRR